MTVLSLGLGIPGHANMAYHTVDRMQQWVQTYHEQRLGWAAVHVRGSVHYYRAEDERVMFGLRGTGTPKPSVDQKVADQGFRAVWRHAVAVVLDLHMVATTVQPCADAHKRHALSRGTPLWVGTTRTRQV